MNHLTHDQLSAELDHALKGRAAEEAERHLLECATCREALAELAAQETELRPALARDPGEAYFERFAARVGERIRAEGLAGDQGRHLGSWWRSPRALAWAGAAAAVIAVTGLILFAGRDVTPPSLRDSGIAGRLDQTPRRAERATGTRTAEPQREEQHDFLTGNPRVLARDRGAAKVQSGGAPGSAPAAPPAAARAYEVRNNAAGEPIPVNRPQAPAVAPSSPAPPAPVEVGDGVRRRAAVQTMKLEEAKQVAGGEEAQAKSAPSAALMASEGRLCGEVLDANGRPIAGAVVVLEDVSHTASTDARGGFCVDAPPGEHPLTVMAVGFNESRQSVEVGGQESSVRVRLAAVPVLNQAWGKLRLGYTGDTRGLAMPAAPPDPYAAQPDSVRADIQMARQLELSGAARHSAAMYDAAAERWARTLQTIAGGALDLVTRGHLADARYHAWETSPTPQRASAAADALTAFLSRSPAGPDRDEATRRLGRVVRR